MPRKKLTKELVAQIRALYGTGTGMRQVDLATRFEVSQQVISQILSGETWRGVKPAKLDKAGSRRGRPKNAIQHWYDDEESRLERVISRWEARGEAGMAEHYRRILSGLRHDRPTRLREDKPPADYAGRDSALAGSVLEESAKARRNQAIWTAFEAVSTYYVCLLNMPEDDQLPRLRDKAVVALSEVHRVTREPRTNVEVEATLTDFGPGRVTRGAAKVRAAKDKMRAIEAITAVAKDMTIDGVREVVMPHDRTPLAHGELLSNRAKQRD